MLQDVFFVAMVYFVLFVFSICLTWSRRCYRKRRVFCYGVFCIVCFQHLFDLEQEMLQEEMCFLLLWCILYCFVFSICLTWSRRCYRMCFLLLWCNMYCLFLASV